jgi:hypothetical protein
MMFRFLRGLFEKEEKPFTLTVGQAGEWLDEREREVEEGLRAKTAETRTSVTECLNGLEEVLRDLEGAEGREDIHPKLRSVTDRSLPVFIPAMRQQIARPLPDDPDAFYAAAADLLAALLKVQKGQGRYLAGVFPEEMKEAKHLTAGIGRSLNDLTGMVKEAREAQGRIDGARAALADLVGAGNDLRSARAEIPGLKSQIARSRSTIAEKEELVRILRDDAEYLCCLGLREQAETLLAGAAKADQDLMNLGAQAARVLRKAERIADRAGEKADAKALAGCIALLDDMAAAGSDAVLAALPRAAETVRAQIARGDLALKGKDDLALFSEEDRIGQAFLDAFSRCSLMKERLSAAQEEVRSCSLPGEIEELEDEIGALASGIGGYRTDLEAKEAEILVLEESLPVRTRTLHDALETVAGRPLSLEGEGFVIAAETKTAQNR